MNAKSINEKPASTMYKDPGIECYQNNPFIEALPPIFSVEQAGRALARYPTYSRADRSKDSHIRYHLIQEALRVFVPLSIHIDLEQRFSRIIRGGYVGRNPVTADYWQKIACGIGQMKSAPRNLLPRANPTSMLIYGVSGGGKTTSTESVLRLYPQVITHTSYKEQAFSRMQIVWLKLPCSYDGSTKGLCLNFFQAVDDLLGTDYYRDYAKSGRASINQLLVAMARVAAIHGLGVLVVDEIQHVVAGGNQGAEKMLNFFVELINSINLPVVLIGTYQAVPVLTKNFRQIRRDCGQGELEWKAMSNDAEWKLFLESIWRYQYVRHETSLTDELVDTLFWHTQGIADVAVKLYMLAQIRAISSGRERITKQIFDSVAADSLRLVQPVLKAIRDKDYLALQQYSDISPVDFGSVVAEAQRQRHISLLSSTASAPDLSPALPNSMAPCLLPLEPTKTRLKEKPSEKNVLAEALKSNPTLPAHQALGAAGFVGTTTI